VRSVCLSVCLLESGAECGSRAGARACYRCRTRPRAWTLACRVSSRQRRCSRTTSGSVRMVCRGARMTRTSSRPRTCASRCRRRCTRCLSRSRSVRWRTSGARRCSWSVASDVHTLALRCFLILTHLAGNERLQEMMGIMARERGGNVFATDERCVLCLWFLPFGLICATA
jgi:hypothetical protein